MYDRSVPNESLHGKGAPSEILYIKGVSTEGYGMVGVYLLSVIVW